MYLYQTMKKANDNVNYENIPQQNLKVIRYFRYKLKKCQFSKQLCNLLLCVTGNPKTWSDRKIEKKEM